MRPNNCPFTSLIHCLALIGFDLRTQVERNATSSMPTHPTQQILARCATLLRDSHRKPIFDHCDRPS
jgi:hypothetical protein